MNGFRAAACLPALAVVFVFSLFANLLMMVSPLYMLQVYDRVLTSHSQETLVFLTVAAVGALVVLGVLEDMRSRVLVKVGAWLEHALAPDLLEHAVQSAVLGARAATTQGLRDLATVRGFLGGSGIFHLFDAPWVPIYVLVIFILHPWLGVVATVGGVVLFFMAMVNDMATRGPLNHANAISNRLYQQADVALRNADSVEAMGMLPRFVAAWTHDNDTALALQSAASDRAGVLSAVTRFLRLGVQIAIIGVGIDLAIDRAVSPGAVIAASILLGRALAPVEQLIGTWRGFVMARVAWKRIGDLLTHPPVVRGTTTIPVSRGRLDIEDVTVMVPGRDRPVLNRVDFALEAGESLGIVGASAAGKSSLARVLVGLWPAAHGAARLDGADLFTWRRDDLGRHIGYLPQDIELFPGTIKHNIARLGDPDDDDVIAAARQAGVHDMILRLPLGYDTHLGDGGVRLSGGQRQRVALARAFYGRPRLLVLDEPNSNLDADGEAALMRALAHARDLGITTILVAHRVHILGNVDKMLWLHDGQMRAFGNRAEVMPRLMAPAAAG